MPHKIYGQHLDYMWETPTTRVWEKLFKEGKLNEAQQKFWKTKPVEELYDLTADRDEINNLAASTAHAATLARLKGALRRHQLEIHDIGLLPEAEIHARGKSDSPYQAGHDPKRFNTQRTLDAAELASSPAPAPIARLLQGLKDQDSAVRYWAAMGAVIRGTSAVTAMQPALSAALEDPAPSVRIAAGEALARFGSEAEATKALEALIILSDANINGAYVAMQALNAIDAAGARAAFLKPRIQALPEADAKAPERVRTEYLLRLKTALL
jgi:uncharacterized sulfatase